MQFDDLLDDLLRPPGRPKHNNTAGAWKGNTTGTAGHRVALMQKAGRIAQRTPEVLVKVSGGARGGRHVLEHLNYITRNGKLTAEDEQGEQVTGRDAVRELKNAWQQGDAGRRRKNSRDTVNLVMSMPPGTDPDRLRDAVRTFAARNFSADRSYVFVRHDDTKHPHCHLTLKAVGHDGRRLNPRKADLQAWRESFAACLRENGIAAEASPRRSRGVVRKGQKQAVLHAKQAGRSRIAKAAVDQAAQRVAGKDRSDRPWEAAIAHRQQQIREGWDEVAERLDAAGSAQATTLAAKVRQFVKNMPPVATERQALEARMRQRLATLARDREQARQDDRER